MRKDSGENAIAFGIGALRPEPNLAVSRHGTLDWHSSGRSPARHEHAPLSRVEPLGTPLIAGATLEGAMIKIIIDAVLFSCMAALITGIVVAATTFIS